MELSSVLQVELMVRSAEGSAEKVALHFSFDEASQHCDQAIDLIRERAEQLAQGRVLKRITYKDDDGDSCTLNKDTFNDALLFVETTDCGIRILELDILLEESPTSGKKCMQKEVETEKKLEEKEQEQAQEHLNRMEVHPNVTCDLCNQGIVGPRYKSLEIEDFDLCMPCYEAEERDASMWTRPRSHVYKEHTAQKVHRGVVCDGCNMHPIVGKRFKCLDLEDYDLCEACLAHSKANPETAARRFEEVQPCASPMRGFHCNPMFWGCGDHPCGQKRESAAETPEEKANGTGSGEQPWNPFQHCVMNHFNCLAGGLDVQQLVQKLAGVALQVVDEMQMPELFPLIDKISAFQNGSLSADALPALLPELLAVASVMPQQKMFQVIKCFKAKAEEVVQELKKERQEQARKKRQAAEDAIATMDEASAKEVLRRVLANKDSAVQEAMFEGIRSVVGRQVEQSVPCEEVRSAEPEKQQDMPIGEEKGDAVEAASSSHEASARVLSCTGLVLGVEAHEDESARGDVTEEFEQLLAQCGAKQVVRVGRIAIPVGTPEPVPACATVVLINDGPIAWPQTAGMVLVAGDSMGFSGMTMGGVESGEGAEITMDLHVCASTEPSARRSAWALVDMTSGQPLGPLFVFEVLSAC